MTRIIIITISLSFVFVSITNCSTNSKNSKTNQSAESIENNAFVTKISDEFNFKGKFISLEKLNEKNYELILKDDKGNNVVFQMFQFEIISELLVESDQNIHLTYQKIEVSENKIIKVVRSLKPIYIVD